VERNRIKGGREKEVRKGEEWRKPEEKNCRRGTGKRRGAGW